MSLITLCFIYIMVLHTIAKFTDKTWFISYKYYWALTNDGYFQLLYKVIFRYKLHYLGAIGEELFFRLPLLYYPWLFWPLIIIFALQHYSVRNTRNQNIQIIVHTFILGIMWSYIVLEDGILYTILLHLLNNFLSTLHSFGNDFKFMHLKAILRQLECGK